MRKRCGNCAKREGCEIDNIYVCFAHELDEEADDD